VVSSSVNDVAAGGKKRKAFVLGPAAEQEKRNREMNGEANGAASGVNVGNANSTAGAAAATATAATTAATATAATSAGESRLVHEFVAVDLRGKPDRVSKFIEHIVEREMRALEQTISPSEASVLGGLRRLMNDFVTEVERVALKKKEAMAGRVAANPRNKELAEQLAVNKELVQAYERELEGWKSLDGKVRGLEVAAREVTNSARSGKASDDPFVASGVSALANGAAVARELPATAQKLSLEVARILRAVRNLREVENAANAFYTNVADEYQATAFSSYGQISDARSIIGSMIATEN
jgi:hypothetical protein